MITTELPILNVSRYIYFAKSQMTFDEIGNLEDDETEVYQHTVDEIWVSYRSDETGIHYSAVYKKSKNNFSKMWCWKSKCCKSYSNIDRQIKC